MEPFLDEEPVGLGRVERIGRDGIHALERRVRADGVPSFRVERVGQNPWLYVVTGVEPAARNRGALGLDVGSGTTRRRAAERAMVTGQAALSRRIRVIEGAARCPGFLLFLPLYAPGRQVRTPGAADRRADWLGVRLAQDRRELTRGLADAGGREIAFAIREEEAAHGAPPLFDTGESTARGTFTRRATLAVEGERWHLDFRARPSDAWLDATVLPTAVLGGGLVASLLVGLLSLAMTNARGPRRDARRDDDGTPGEDQRGPRAGRRAVAPAGR